MNFIETKLSGVYIIELSPFTDERGWFVRYFCKREFQEIGHDREFVQFNHSFNYQKGTVRGMHYQVPPDSEIKLIRCIRGRVWDVLVDLRENSPTFLQYVAVELAKENMNMVYVPMGVAHGFQTLEDNSELLYHHTQFYTPGAERGIYYDDKVINIQWPEKVTSVSDKDKNYSLLNDSFKGVKI